MSAETPPDIDRAAIEEHAQRTVEQAALRKVRKSLDKIEEMQVAERRTLRRVLIVCGIVALLGAWLLWETVFSGRDFAKTPRFEVPSALPRKQ
jgi:hypothetical protein